MPDSLLILAPLLVLGVVLLLGFAGCTFEHGIAPTPTPTLTFRAKVPTALTVQPPGVKFRWTLPNGTSDEAYVVVFAPGPSVQKYIDRALTLGPSLFWALGSDNGLTDRSPNGRNGTALGGVTVGGEQDGPTDFADATATNFDGVDDRIASAYNPYVGTGGRTFVGWTRRDNSTTSDLLFGSSAAAGADQARLFLGSSQTALFQPNGNDGQTVVWTNAWPGDAQWVWWALRFDQVTDKASLLINGQLVSTQGCTELWSPAPGNFQVGAAGTTGTPLGGDSALIGVYEKLLTDAELTTLYQASQDGGDKVYEHPIPSPVAGTWFGRCEMTVVEDASQPAHGDSGDFMFELPATSQSYALEFEAAGSPSAPPFRVKALGRTPE